MNQRDTPVLTQDQRDRMVAGHAIVNCTVESIRTSVSWPRAEPRPLEPHRKIAMNGALSDSDRQFLNGKQCRIYFYAWPGASNPPDDEYGFPVVGRTGPVIGWEGDTKWELMVPCTDNFFLEVERICARFDTVPKSRLLIGFEIHDMPESEPEPKQTFPVQQVSLDCFIPTADGRMPV